MLANFDSLDQQTQLILTALIQSEHRISKDHRRDVRTSIAQLMSRHEIFAIDEHCLARDLTANGRKEESASLPVVRSGEIRGCMQRQGMVQRLYFSSKE